ncbi:MAG: PH domain-containing protein [Azonexus sp.]|nr:PH domain-containing protein [Azonexus sp.]
MNDPHIDSAQAAALGSGAGLAYAPERELLWASREGQVVNFWVYVLTVLTCWLIVPLLWAGWRYLVTAKHRYELTDQRFLEYSGILVKRMDTLELYRVIDIKVDGTPIQSLFGLGQVKLLTHDKTTPRVTINAIAQPAQVANLIRDAVEQSRVAKGVRAFDS